MCGISNATYAVEGISMPVYEYRCECGSEREVILPFAEFDKPQTCVCGRVMWHKMPTIHFATKPYAKNMALDTLNKRGNGTYQGMPNRWWKPEAERKAFEGTQKKPKAMW